MINKTHEFVGVILKVKKDNPKLPIGKLIGDALKMECGVQRNINFIPDDELVNILSTHYKIGR